MYKRNGIKKLGRKKSHRDALIRNQIRSLLKAGSLKTTTPKAKVLRQKASKFINKAARISDNKVIFNRTVEQYIGKGIEKTNLQKVLDSKDFSVSMVKIGFRDGDNAEVTRVSLPALMKTKKKVAKTAPKGNDKKKAKTDNKDDAKKKFANTDKKTQKGVDTKGHAEGPRARSRSGL